MPKKRKEETDMPTAVLERPAPPQEDLVTLAGAAAAIGRTRTELLALLDKPVYRSTFPHSVAGRGLARRVRRTDVTVWGVEEGLITADGRVLVGYMEISAMLGYASEQSARKLESDRKKHILETGKPALKDIPKPFDYFGKSANRRPAWLRDDPDPRVGMIRWAKHSGAMAEDGSPQRRRSGGWTPSPDAVVLPAGRPGQRRRR